MRPIIETINSIIGGQSGSPQYQELIKKAYQDPEVQSFCVSTALNCLMSRSSGAGQNFMSSTMKDAAPKSSDQHCSRLYPSAGC